ncbi:helix-turn-helix domain-containing protein [Dysgonomonas capnocytophagoides]|uniref:Helix-turn-helix domain-containing protein n=1 Tax=Dysgonomonas capnocytophagoides TaxID=45254 RepID=A0A4Y8L1X2_9BACT|nr:helix-turn-helix transcriptional regulator [Dysgonomonas capnocytophagoides]TFD95502.1 helix-turn-helix domain-containing protein [Dysgonomonas capnocytophagoides]
MTVGDRLKYVLELKDVTPYKIGKDTPVSRAMIGNYISGENEPSVKNIILIAEYLGVNLNWLLTGKGDIFQNKVESEDSGYKLDNNEKQSTVNEPIAVYGLGDDVSITDPKYKEHSLLNSINNMSQAMIISANASERNSKNMEKLINLLSKKIEDEDLENKVD